MAVYTLFNQSGGGSNSGASSPFSMGNQFSVSQNCALTGIWFYSPSGATGLPTTCGIGDADNKTWVSGTENTSPTWSGGVGSGWVKCTYDGSITLVPGTNYMVIVFWSTATDVYSQTDAYWTSGPGASGITNGPLSAPGSAESLYGQSAYNASSTYTFPTSTITGYNFWIDVEVGTAPASSGLLMSVFP